MQIAATNARGQGDYSDLNTVGSVAKVVPHTPTQAPTRGSNTNDGQLDVQWEFVTDIQLAGGADFTGYALYRDDGKGGDFIQVQETQPTYTLNSVTLSTGIQSGLTYRVKYTVSNIYGESQFSPISTITAMTVPGAPQQVIVDYDEDRVRVDWTAPAFTGGDKIPLTSYNVELLTNATDIFATVTCQEP